MSAKTLFALTLSHAAVAAVTWYLVHQVSIAPSKSTMPGTNPSNLTIIPEVKLEQFVKEMSQYTGGSEVAVRVELLQILRHSEQLDASDRQLIVGLRPEDVTNKKLADFQIVRSFLDTYANSQKLNALRFTSEKYQPALQALLADAEPSPERTRVVKVQLRQLANAIVTLRKQALALPYTDTDDRLQFLELKRTLASEKYSDVRELPETSLPLLNDREGSLLAQADQWLNSSSGRKAFPIEDYGRLYRDGRIEAMSSAWSAYRERIQSRLKDELMTAQESHPGAKEDLARGYSLVESFFTSLAQMANK